MKQIINGRIFDGKWFIRRGDIITVLKFILAQEDSEAKLNIKLLIEVLYELGD